MGSTRQNLYGEAWVFCSAGSDIIKRHSVGKTSGISTKARVMYRTVFRMRAMFFIS